MIRVMIEEVFEPIEVEASFSQGIVSPTAFSWGRHRYPVEQVIFAHQRRHGRTMRHYFSLLSQETVYEVVFDPEHFTWTLARIHLPGA